MVVAREAVDEAVAIEDAEKAQEPKDLVIWIRQHGLEAPTKSSRFWKLEDQAARL